MAILSLSRGLVTQPSELTRPDGALEIADNCVIDSDNVIEPRRGFSDFGNQTTSGEDIKQLLTYKGRVLRHYSDKLSFDSTGNGDFLDFSGSYLELVEKLRIKYFESNSNLYFTTSTGIKKISATSADDFTTDANFISNAGGVKAIGLQAVLKPSEAGWLPAQSKVAYKLLWAIKDNNGNIIRGTPSSRVVVTNNSQDLNVGESFTITVGASFASIANSDYFLFDTPTRSYAIWFNKTGSATAPTGASLLNRELFEVNISGLSTADTIAAQIASVLNTISDIQVSLVTNQITVENIDGGDVLDASQGTLLTNEILISKVYDGQTAIGSPANVELTFDVPVEINSTQYFYELYRTATVTTDIGVTLEELSPDEEFQKVYEAPITNNGTIPTSITIEDITPETFRNGGAYLYTNPISGEGVINANETPPIAKDIALFKGSAFYANTKERHRIQLNLLSVTDFISGSSKLYIGNTDVVREYTFVGSAQSLNLTVLPKSETVGNSYILLNSARDLIKYKIWFDKGIIQHDFNSTTNVDALNDIITVTNHGYANNDAITFSGTLPTGLSSSQTYYVINRTTNTFKVSDSIGGPAINIGTASGTCTVTHTPLEPIVANTLTLRVALQTYDDTLQGSVDSFLDTMFDILDFTVEDATGGVISISYNDNGAVSDPSDSTPSSGWVSSIVTYGEGEDALSNNVLLSGLSSEGLSVEDTARSLERIINKDALSPVNAFYLSGADDLPGKLLLEARSLEDKSFYLGVNSSTISSKFNPELPSSITITDISTSGNIFTTSTNHGYIAGQEVYIHDNPTGSSVEFSGNYVILSTPSLNTFTLSGITVTTNQSGINGLVFKTDVTSDNSVNPNRVYFSKLYQPEAVPLVNYIDIGPKDKEIQRIIALKDSLVVLKEDGVYIISGSSAPNFFVRLVDSSSLILAPDTAVSLNNLIYALSTQGVVTISDTGVGVISRNIENKIQEVANVKFDYKLTSWGLSSESDRAYFLWLPTKTTDNKATQAYRYNIFTRTWTRWTKPATCGVVNPNDDKIYLGDGSSRPYVLKERKNFERSDHSDGDFVKSINTGSVSSNSIILNNVVGVEIGDVITQTQYLDVNKFNRFLKKLDRDSLNSNDYYATLQVAAGSDLSVSLTDLYAKLTLDGIAIPMPSSINTPENVRDDFNAIVNYLNTPLSGTGFKNYRTVVDALLYEVLILDVNKITNTITTKFEKKFLVGEVTIYKGIRSIVQYAPQHFGKPEATKQVSEGTFIFDQNNFWSGTVGYSSDRSYDFSSIDFSIKGPGYWGGYNWANVTFGGLGNEVPVRTLIPKNKSRCRYLHVQFIHINAREKWRLLGVSLEPREVSTRGYR